MVKYSHRSLEYQSSFSPFLNLSMVKCKAAPAGTAIGFSPFLNLSMVKSKGLLGGLCYSFSPFLNLSMVK